MATSAAKLSEIIDVLAEEYDFDSKNAISFLASKGILPKKLIPSPPATPKKVSLFASKQAKEFAEENGINTEGIVGSGVGGKLTLSDVKAYMTPPPKKSKLNAWNYRYKKLMKTGYEDIRKALQNIRRHQTRVRDKIRREEEILAEHGRVMSAKQRKEYQDMLDDLEEKKHVLEAKRRKINEDEKMYQRQCRELKKMSGVKPDDASDDGEEDEKAPSSSIPRVDDLSSLNGEKAGRSEPSGSRRKRAVDEEKPAEIEGDPSLKRMQHSGSSIPITEYSAV